MGSWTRMSGWRRGTDRELQQPMITIGDQWSRVASRLSFPFTLRSQLASVLLPFRRLRATLSSVKRRPHRQSGRFQIQGSGNNSSKMLVAGCNSTTAGCHGIACTALGKGPDVHDVAEQGLQRDVVAGHYQAIRTVPASISGPDRRNLDSGSSTAAILTHCASDFCSVRNAALPGAEGIIFPILRICFHSTIASRHLNSLNTDISHFIKVKF